MRNGLKRIMAILIATLILLGALPASALETESSNVVVPGIDLAGELDSADQPAVIAGEVDIADGAEITLTVEDEVTVRSVAEDRNSDRNHQERWSSSDATIAAVVGQRDSAYSYAQTNATITAVAPGVATITHHYWTRTGRFYTWSEQTETITVNVQPAPQPRTVTFNVGEAAEGGVTVPDPIVVMDGQTVSELPTLEWRDESGEIVKIFAGWYSNEGLTTEFTENTPVTGDITLYARWVKEDRGRLWR